MNQHQTNTDFYSYQTQYQEETYEQYATNQQAYDPTGMIYCQYPMMMMYQPVMPVIFPGQQGYYPTTFHPWQYEQNMALYGASGNYEETSISQTWQAEGIEPTANQKRPFEDTVESWAESKKIKLSEAAPMSKFEKQFCCGKGTFGEVYCAKEITTGRTVALKQIKLNGKEGFPRTAIREIIIMKKHTHPNILSIEEVVWAEDGDVFLVMDYYNYDLRKLIEKHQLRFNESEVKFLFSQLAKGVAYLHDNVLMHRDLKTENILINAKGHLKICDFGLARTFYTEKTYTPVVITLWYRPPELLLGPCAYSCEVDQWSVGCIFAELIRGSVLFTGSNDVDQVDKIFSIMGTPNEDTWPDYEELPGAQKISFRTYPNRLRTLFPPDLISLAGFDLLSKLLTCRPNDRITAEETLQHDYFSEEPEPVNSIAIDLMIGKNKS